LAVGFFLGIKPCCPFHNGSNVAGNNVYYLSALSRNEAEELINTREGNLCVRLYRRADGTVMTRDCRRVFKRITDCIRAIGALMVGSAMVALAYIPGYETLARQQQTQTKHWLFPAPPPPPSARFMGKLERLPSSAARPSTLHRQ
jgi:hypothetical protein